MNIKTLFLYGAAFFPLLYIFITDFSKISYVLLGMLSMLLAKIADRYRHASLKNNR